MSRWYLALISALFVVAGCGGGGDKQSNVLVSVPPAPLQSGYAVITQNYFFQYDDPVADPPFSAAWQFADQHYPIPVSFSSTVTEPEGFSLVEDTKQAILAWAASDPRICVVSGVEAKNARIQIFLERTISYAGQTNIIGLTTVRNSNSPSFKVEVATSYLRSGGDPENPSDYIQMSSDDIAKTLMHELGHAFGLGHSPESRDLMFYMANSNQGSGYDDFVTFGDAMAIWTTLNDRKINWVTTRPPVVQETERSRVAHPLTVGERGEPVCVYAK